MKHLKAEIVKQAPSLVELGIRNGWVTPPKQPARKLSEFDRRMRASAYNRRYRERMDNAAG